MLGSAVMSKLGVVGSPVVITLVSATAEVFETNFWDNFDSQHLQNMKQCSKNHLQNMKQCSENQMRCCKELGGMEYQTRNC